MSDKIKMMAKQEGLDGAKCAEVIKAGLTEEAAAKAASFGVSLNQLWLWIQQFGPQAIKIFNEIMALLQQPMPAPVPAGDPNDLATVPAKSKKTDQPK